MMILKKFIKNKYILNSIIIKRYASTIFALSSGYGKCGVSVIRISGSNSKTALKLLTNLKNPPEPRKAILKSIRHPKNGEVLDKGLVLWFPGPNSFTGEDSFELQVHGSVAVVNSVLSALGSIEGLKPAEAGEFTKRAFFNGKLDLTEIEGLADLIHAETEMQRKQAFLQMEGALSKLYNKWKEKLIKTLAHIEMYLNFDESDDLDMEFLRNLFHDVKNLRNDIEKHLNDGRKGEILRNGVKLCIIGEPNAGKSSLLNILCNRQAAIVTPIEGTTRDILEVNLNFGGYPVVLADTAGLRENTKDVIEQEGILKAKSKVNEVDLVLLVIDSFKYLKSNLNLDLYIKQILPSDLNLSGKNVIKIFNKIDLVTESINNLKYVKISCKDNRGIDSLINEIIRQLKELCANPTKENPSMTQTRHKKHLNDCLNCLDSFLKKSEQINENSVDLVLLAEELRKAVKHLEKLLGKITTDDILDVIFKDFCIGK